MAEPGPTQAVRSMKMPDNVSSWLREYWASEATSAFFRASETRSSRRKP